MCYFVSNLEKVIVMGKIDVVKSWFPDLTNEEARQLCYITYFGEDSGSSVSRYTKAFHVSRKRYDDTNLHLIQLGYLKTHNCTSPDHHLDVLDFLAIEHMDWIEEFKKIRNHPPTHFCEYLWKLSNLIRKGYFKTAGQLPKPYQGLGHDICNIYPYIRNRIVDDARYALLLNVNQLGPMVSDTLEEYLHQGKLDQITLDSMRAVSKSGVSNHELEEQIDFYEFLVTGKRFTYNNPSTLWAFSLMAIQELYAGHTEEALSLFQKAVQKQRGNLGSLPIPILNFFYAVCIVKYRMKYGSNHIPELVKSLSQSSLVRFTNNHFAPRLLLEYADSFSQTSAQEVKKRANMVMEYAGDNLNRSFAVLITSFFSLSKENIHLLEGHLPSTAIMMHELSPYLAISSKVKEDLENRFGGKPLLANVRRKQFWEVLLGEIGQTVEKPEEQIPRRIVYFLKGVTLSSIVEQSFRDGEWKDGALLSLGKFCKEGYDSMDLRDSRIAMQLANKHELQSDADIIIPQMAGTDRLFYGMEYLPERIPITVKQENPYIDFSGDGDKIVVSSNVNVTTWCGVQKHTVTRLGTTYNLVSIGPLQKDILQKLWQQKTFPASAAPSLKKMIESLKGIIEVRENILSDIEKKAFESEGRIVIRIEPEAKNRFYDITLLAVGLLNGTARFTPTVGEEYVYDMDEDGCTHCVHRNMAMEERNYQGIVDYAEQFGIEFSGYNTFSIEEERILLNFLAFIHRNPTQYMVEWPNGQKLKFKGILTNKDITVDVKSDNEWFSVEGKAMVGVDVLGLDELIAACCNQVYEGFVRIGENEYLQITDTLRRHIAELDAMMTLSEHKQKRIPKYLIGALANTLEQMNHTVDSGYKEFREKMKEVYQQEVPIPQGINALLRPYQEEGFRWMARLDGWGAGACLADDMGLGKTLQAITFLAYKAEKGPSLVLAPKSVIPNWVRELGKFAPSLHVFVLNDVSNREQAIQEVSAHSVVLCTYGVLTTEAERLAGKQWNVVCLDEAHQIKNRMTMASHAAMELKAGSRIILTGTPIQNHVGELWNLMQFLNPGMLGRWNTFRDNFINTELDEEHRSILKEMTQPFILRRTKQQVLTDLPEKMENTYYVTMNEDEYKVYETMRQRVELKFKKSKTMKEKQLAKTFDISYFEELMKLRLASCDMHLINDKWMTQSSKITALMEVLETLMAVDENNILLFSQFTSFLSLIRKELDERGWEYHYLDGQTPMEKRETMVEEFQDGEKRLFLSSLKAGGLGINLTKANYVILMDPWWNPAIENQATDRAHRIGQKRCVSVIRFISQHTIEEKIIRLHEKKQSISNEVLDGTENSGKLTYDDILDMVSPY